MRPRLPLLPLLLSLLLPGLALAQSLRFTSMDIGQGDSAVLVAPGGCAVLFDGGPTGSGNTIKAYLKSIGVTHIQMAFVSHLHTDHMGGIDEVDVGTDAVPIDAVYDNGGTYDSNSYDEYATHFAGKRNTAVPGQTYSVCNQVTLKVLHSGTGSGDENANSVVVKISYGAFDALVGGDLTGITPNEEAAIASAVGPVELYKVHHHGSKYSSNANFLGTLLPLASFISVGIGNTYGHPAPETLAALGNVGSDIWQTEDPALNRKNGHIVLTSATGASFTVTQGTAAITYSSKGQTGDTQAPTAPGSLVASAVSSSEVDLSWSASTDDVGVTGYRVYRSTNGNSFTLAGTTTATSTGFADLGLAVSTTYWYRVTAIDAAVNESPASATVSAITSTTRLVTVTSPNGGEFWSVGSTHPITWTSSKVANVKLEYSLNKGVSWVVIASSVAASTGSYAWTLPATASIEAKVRVTDALNGMPSDVSNTPFTISTGAPGQLVLNEILANEPGSDTDAEFIELVNSGTTAMDLSGWTLWDAVAVRHTFAAGTTVAPGKALVVYANAAKIPPGVTNAVGSTTGSLSLNNTGDTVTLKSGMATVTSYTYAGSLAGVDGVSMNRSPDGTDTGTFVLHNSISTLGASPGKHVNGTDF